MVLITLIATHYPPPEYNPVSQNSFITLIMCCAIALLLGQPGYRYSLFRQVVAVVVAMFLITWIAFCRYGVIPARGPTNADVYAIIAICAAFGLAYGLSACRGPSMLTACLSLLATTPAVFVIGLFLIRCVEVIIHEYSSTHSSLPELLTLSVCILAAANWALLSIWMIPYLQKQFVRKARLAQGQCLGCAYDLRGSIGRPHCPECGIAIPWEAIQFPVEPKPHEVSDGSPAG